MHSLTDGDSEMSSSDSFQTKQNDSYNWNYKR